MTERWGWNWELYNTYKKLLKHADKPRMAAIYQAIMPVKWWTWTSCFLPGLAILPESVEGQTLATIHLTITWFKILFQNNLGNLITFLWLNHLMLKLKSDTGVIHCRMCKLYICIYISLISVILNFLPFWIFVQLVLGFSPSRNIAWSHFISNKQKKMDFQF